MGDGKDYCRLAISDKMYKADVEVDRFGQMGKDSSSPFGGAPIFQGLVGWFSHITQRRVSEGIPSTRGSAFQLS